MEIFQVFSVALFFMIIIGTHEFGHMVAAKRVGLTVKEFAIGMGPVIFSFNFRNTKYSLRIIPIGGFVNILGISKEDPAEECQKYESLRLRSKLFIYVSGILFNLITCWIIYTALYFAGFTAVFPSVVPNNSSPVVYKIESNSIAQKAGLKNGDIILEYNKVPVTSAMNLAILAEKNKVGVIKFTRENKTMEIKIKRNENQPLGLSVADKVVASKFRAPLYALGQTAMYFLSGFVAFFLLIKELLGFHMIEGAAGPIGISVMAYEMSGYGFAAYLQLIAIVCACIATFNLLPIGPLDGGCILFETVKKIFGKRVNSKYIEAARWVGVVPIVLLVVIFVFNDIIKFIK